MPSTVRVKIAVAVDEDGNWCSIGYNKMPDDDHYMAGDALGQCLRWFWLESDLPLPVMETRTAQEMVEFKSSTAQ